MSAESISYPQPSPGELGAQPELQFPEPTKKLELDQPYTVPTDREFLTGAGQSELAQRIGDQYKTAQVHDVVQAGDTRFAVVKAERFRAQDIVPDAVQGEDRQHMQLAKKNRVWRLVSTEDPSIGVDIGEGGVTVGRNPGNSLVPEKDLKVSRTHFRAALEPEDPEDPQSKRVVRIADLDSSNGTWVVPDVASEQGAGEGRSRGGVGARVGALLRRGRA